MLVYDPNAAISTHFTMYEVARSDTADRCLIDNTPNSEVLTNAVLLARHVLEPIRVHFGKPFRPNSWYRGEELEKEICKKSYPQWCARKGLQVNDATWDQYFALKSHPKGQAADIEIAGVANDDLYQWIQDNIVEWDQLIREFPKPGVPDSGWVHVSFNIANNRKQVFTIG